MCGILGIIGYDDIAGTLLEGLTSIQHRGQDAAGIVTFNHRFHLHKGDGLVSQAFSLSFTLADNMEVSGATFTNGLLHIDLTRNEPEQIAPQRIAISERPALNS